jgi:hypothetical protein
MVEVDKERLEKLKSVFEKADGSVSVIVIPMIEEIVFLEAQLKYLKEQPLIKVHPEYPELQKITKAGKLYREYLQTYVNAVDKLVKYCGDNGEGEKQSPLREFWKEFSKGLEVR